MNTKIKKCCPNCSQFFSLKLLSSKQNAENIPLFLKCGHSMCENCITNLVKFEEPIECKVCHKDMEIQTKDVKSMVRNKLKLRRLFPVNIYMLGELSLELLESKDEIKNNDDDCFLNLKAIIQATETCQGQCLECTNPTTKMCRQCATVLCEVCFNKSHKNFVIFRNHVLQNIEPELSLNNCKVHTEKTLDYYCKDCSKPICMDCLVIGGEKSCKNHNLVSTQEVNEKLLEDLAEICPKVDETYRRLTKTAVDIGHLLYNIGNDTGSSELLQIEKEVEQSFSKLSFIVQVLKGEAVNKIIDLRTTEKESLENAKKSLADSIKNAKYVLNSVKKSLSVEKIKQANMSLLLEDAKKVVNSPWYLNQNKAELNVVVNEEVCNLLANFIHLDGETDGTFKLLTTDEIDPNIDIPPPPVAPVFPPELPKDVRVKRSENKADIEKDNTKSQTFYTKAPTYHSKSASISSLNSLNSDSSYKSSSNRDEGLYKPVHQVSPYQENQQPKALCAGGQELVYISHIVTPHNFYVQRVIHMPMLEELIKEFRNAISLPKPSVNSIAEGKSYLVFNKVDNLWQRCQVKSIDRKDSNKHLYHVFCVDFGSIEVVTIDKLRLLPPARAQSPCPFAINCSLVNCEPLAGAWSSDDALLIQNITDNKQTVVHIHRVRSKANSVSLECDVTTYEAGVSLTHALVFQGRARLCNPKMPYPKNINASQKPKLFINNNDYKLKTVEEVYITSITSPDHFYVRKLHLQSVYEKLCEDLDQNYNINVKKGSIYLPEKDMVCVVNLEKYEVPDANTSEARVTWARAIVTELPGRGRVRLALPDCGATLVAHWSALRRILPKFTTLRALATECHLAGVTPLNKKWSPNSVALLHTFRGRPLDLHVDDNRNLSLGVTLYDKTEPEVVCVNTQMVKYKFAVIIGTFMFNKENVLQDCVITNKLPVDQEKSPEKSKNKTNKIKVLKKEELPKCTVKKEQLEAKDKGPLRLEAKVLYYQSPSLIYVSLVHQQKTFNTLFENIQKHYSKKKIQSKNNWNVGDKCCTMCRQSQTWRRATILDLQGDDAKVFYSDFACVETVPITTLRELTQEFSAIGYAAMKCHLSGVVSADGEDWPSLTKEYLKELLDAYKRVFITKMGNFKDMSMPIEMWVYHTIQGSALEPNTSEWRCLNKKIIEQGLAIPDKSQQVETPNDNADKSDDNMLSFLNVKGSIEEWLQLEPMPTKPLIVQSNSDRSNSSSPECEINFSDDKAKKANTVFISDWMPPEPPPNKEFIGVPTYVDNDGIIYLHEVSQQETLEMIQKALDVRFKKPDPKAKYASWSVGEPCIAMYYLDDKFYRGRILEVNKEASTCLVHYIDYGNDETCNFSNLRKSIALYQLPTQALKCVLTRVEPADKFWDRQTLDYMHKSMVEKKCFIKITGNPIDGIYPIELTYNKLLFNDHLVEFEMAKYSDGSKAVIRRFAPIDNQQIELDESATIESDSAPDYIIEEDDIESANDSYCMEFLQGKDWNLLIQEDKEKQMLSGKFLTFKKNTIENFICNITVINDFKCFELFILHDEATIKEYEEMFEKLQKSVNDMPSLNGIYENKACVAIFNEDGQWYRATILQYSNDTNQIKVRYVDYGNIELVTLADVREINKEFINLPPLTLSATLHNVQVNPAIETSVIAEEYKNTFLDKGPFNVKIIHNETEIPSVELRNEKSELVYKDLIANNTFLLSSNE
ncbi:PREDICTED: uncharacterized protein LOC106122488 isoform X1 [Papilio xuthus]|uniref:Uncharacterized protein LOC106122488 isoform X1 n=1 Tax=Papilio xuthus TaxID=66420 RepID=A0AAJ6ZJN5_PAPXU|nr:PREDICTED: uncharacterized protein LOC106122488 isoform X1 [Papilio xuthus]